MEGVNNVNLPRKGGELGLTPLSNILISQLCCSGWSGWCLVSLVSGESGDQVNIFLTTFRLCVAAILLSSNCVLISLLGAVIFTQMRSDITS